MSSRNTLARSSNNILSFKCCKTKHFIHYICIKCQSVFHKSCLTRFRSKIRFVKENKIICCEDINDSHTSDQDDEKSILEDTISELTSDSDLKSAYIKKLQMENKLFVQEATKLEEEMTDLIKSQEKIIEDLNKEISRLQKDTCNKKTSKTIGTQTNMIKLNKNVSTSTDNLMSLTSGVVKTIFSLPETQCTTNLLNSVNRHDIINSNVTEIDVMNPTRIEELPNNNSLTNNHKIVNTLTVTPESSSQAKKQILILADENGKHLNQTMRRHKKLKSYNILSICKPYAYMMNILEGIANLTANFTPNDYIIIIAGSNDVYNNKYPSFRYLCDKLKLCVHTNIIVCSLPYGRNKGINSTMFKINVKLNGLSKRLNSYSDNSVCFLDINKARSRINNTYNICNKLSELIENLKYINNNLTYVQILSKDEVVQYSGSAKESNGQDETSPSTQHVIDLTKNSEKDAEIHQLFRK